MLLTTAGGRHVFLYVRRGLLLAPQLIFLCVSEFSCIMCCCVSAVPSAYMLISMCYSAVVYSRQLPVLQIVHCQWWCSLAGMCSGPAYVLLLSICKVGTVLHVMHCF